MAISDNVPEGPSKENFIKAFFYIYIQHFIDTKTFLQFCIPIMEMLRKFKKNLLS